MTAYSWEQVDVIILRLNHAMVSAMVTATPHLSLTATNLILSQIETTLFFNMLAITD